MPNDMLRIADFVGNALDLADNEISDLRQQAPFLMALPMEPSSHGTKHNYTKETGAPVVGFRGEYKGRCFDHSTDALVSVDLSILDFSWMVDQAVAAAYSKRRGGRDGLIAREGLRHLNAAMFMAEKQFINGQAGATWTDVSGAAAGAANGFTGLADALDDLAIEQVYSAGGSTADSQTSVYLVRMNAETDLAGVMIEDAPFQIGETVSQNITITNDPDANAQGPDGCSNYPGWYTPGFTWMALQIGGKFSVVRICNVEGNLTDDKIFAAMALFPANRKPTHALMNQQALESLRASRTATNGTGAPAPIPTVVGTDTQIIVTDAIGNDEPVIVAA